MRSTFKTVLVAMLAMLALSAVAASAAQAEEAPYFKVAGARLAEGQSKEVAAKAGEVNIQIGEGSGALRMKCSLTLASGAKLLGSSIGNPGRFEMTTELTKCVVEDEGCEVTNEPVKSQLLLATLVSSEKQKGRLEVLLKAKTGSLLMMPVLNRSCGYGEDQGMSGSVVAEVYSGGKPVEIGKEPAEATTLKLVLPEHRITHCWLMKEGTGEEERVSLTGSLGNDSMEGSSTLELKSGSVWGVFT